MKNQQMMNEIREANLSYLILAQSMLKEDHDAAIYRLGVHEDVADIIAGLTPAHAPETTTPKTAVVSPLTRTVRAFDIGSSQRIKSGGRLSRRS